MSLEVVFQPARNRIHAIFIYMGFISLSISILCHLRYPRAGDTFTQDMIKDLMEALYSPGPEAGDLVRYQEMR